MRMYGFHRMQQNKSYLSQLIYVVLRIDLEDASQRFCLVPQRVRGYQSMKRSLKNSFSYNNSGEWELVLYVVGLDTYLNSDDT